MKTRTIILMLLSTAFIFTSCCKMGEDYVTPSAEVTEQEKLFTNFTELDVSDAFKVYVTFSEGEESVRIEANKNLHSHIQVSQYNNRLNIKLDNVRIRNGSATLNVYITMQQLREVVAAGATHVKIQNPLIGDDLHMQLTGASSLEGNLQLQNLYTTIDGASNINISGSSGTFNLIAEGASNMESYDFETLSFTGDLEGACNARLRIQESINIRAKGASNLYYKGDAVVRSQNLTGASHIYKMD